jgi:hypothetical protein
MKNYVRKESDDDYSNLVVLGQRFQRKRTTNGFSAPNRRTYESR